MASVRFSVIIPVYNQSEYLGTAIESALSQTYPAYEVIVVDDGSTDGSSAVAQSYGHRVRYLRQDNAGVSAARNLGAEAATGDWLAFLDADDWYYSDRLACHARWLSRDQDLDFLTGDYDCRRPDGSFISQSMKACAAGRAMLARAAGATEVIMTADDLEPFVTNHFGDTDTLSVPRETFLAIGGYPVGYNICEDIFLLVRLCAVSRRIGVVCVPMAAYRIHEVSATRRDRMQAQIENVRTLVALRSAARSFPKPVRRGVDARLRRGRQHLGHAFTRRSRRWRAMQAVFPTIWESPGLGGVRDLISMARG